MVTKLEEFKDIRTGVSKASMALVLENSEPRDSKVNNCLELCSLEGSTKESIKLPTHMHVC